MKINLVLPHQLPFPPTRGGGVEFLNWTLSREIAALGHEVVAYSRITNGEVPVETMISGLRHVRVLGYNLNGNRWIDHANALRYARNVWNTLEAADVTLFHTPFSFLLRHKRGIGVCAHTLHRTPKVNVWCYSGLDRIYCGSNAVVEQAIAIAPWTKNLKRIYNCIAVGARPVACPFQSKRGLTFLYVGRFVADKGITSLIVALRHSLTSYPHNRLLTVGPQTDETGADGRFFQEMVNYVRAMGIGNAISFLPPVFDRSALNQLMTDADVICVPSLTGETFSMAVLEAMALGKPVLVSDFGPMPEAVDHKVTGYVARAGDAASLADGMRFFSERASSLVEIGSAGHEKVKREFSVEKIAKEYLADFAELIRLKRFVPRVFVSTRTRTSAHNNKLF